MLIEPEDMAENYEQAEPFERLYGEIITSAINGNEDECLYDDPEFRDMAKLIDWNEDARKLGITSKEKLRELATWLKTKKESVKIVRDLAASGGLPSQLNTQQFKAFAILRKHLLESDRLGVGKASQLLLNISGSAGTGTDTSDNPSQFSIKSKS